MSITPSTLGFALINFFVMLVIIRVFLYKPVLNILDSRKAAIEEDFSAADKAKTEALALKADYEATVKNAHKEAQEILNTANKIGEEERAKFVAQARTEAENITTRARAEIEREKSQAITDLRQEVANLAVDAATQVIGREVKKADHEKLLDEFLDSAKGVDAHE